MREDEDPADIAWKLVAVNLSDLAAKGAEPVGVLIGHMLGSRDERFVEGLRAVLAEYDVPLLGGDTVRAEGRRVWGCTAIGRATSDPVPDRRGAKAGDAVYVTGTLGRAMLGFEEPHGPHCLAICTILYFIVYIMVLGKWRVCRSGGEGAELCNKL